MTRVIVIAAVPFLILFGTLITAKTIVSDDPDHALISADNHGILFPGSDQEFRFPPRSQATGGRAQAPAGVRSPASPEKPYPASLYRLSEESWGWTLRIKQQENIGSVVLISPTYTTPQGRTVYALRSSEPIGNTNRPEISWGTRLLGPSDGLFFLATSAPVADPELGNAFRIYIPRKAIYGYGKEGLGEYTCEAGGFVRLRLYGLPHAHRMAKSSTYIIPFTANITGANPAPLPERVH
jgi:hypothetical protein